jgi:hypothetical protein
LKDFTLNEIDIRLDGLRGPVEPSKHDARTIAALTSNPGCTRRRVLDAAAIDKKALAEAAGFPSPFGASPFAIVRGKIFEQQVKANGCAELLRLLRELYDLSIPEVSYADLNSVGGIESLEARHRYTLQLLVRTAESAEDAGTLFDHPLLTMGIGGRNVYLEPDLVAFRLHGRFHIVEVKSFPVIDRRADPAKVAAAAMQSAVYVLALRRTLEALGFGPDLVSHEVFLVCPEDFSNRPTATRVDVRKQLTVLLRQLERLVELGPTVSAWPRDLSLDLRKDGAGVPTRSPAELLDALGHLEPRYAPERLSTCELAFLCRDAAAGHTAALGRDVQEGLGGVETVASVLALADGSLEPDDHEVESARLLLHAEQLRCACLGGAA